MSSKKYYLLKLLESSLKTFPSPSSVTLLSNMLKLVYTYSSPYTNSKSLKEVFVPINDHSMKQGSRICHQIESLSWDEKTNTLKQNNTFETVLTEEIHEKVLMDDVFGRPRLSKNKQRWAYIAKKKSKKSKSYFLQGVGKHEFVADFGETYEDVTDCAIFIWDLELRKVFEVELQIEGNSDQYIVANPVFMDAAGTKVMCHGYKRTEFGHGLLHCFNRPVSIFEVTLPQSFEFDKAEKPKYTFKTRVLVDKEQTNIFANISTCSNYIFYFGGSGITHTYYMDLVILKKSEEDSWQELHRIKQVFVGYYDTAKSLTFELEGEPYAYFQILEAGSHVIRSVNLRTGEHSLVGGSEKYSSYSIDNYSEEKRIVMGTFSCHQYSSFFYLPFGGQIQVIEPDTRVSDVKLETYTDPIHGFYLESQSEPDCQELRRGKKPLIVMVHGGPHGASQPVFTVMRHVLLKCGYALLYPNFSGSAGFGPDYLKKSLGGVGEIDAKEILQLLDKVLEDKPHLDRERVYVHGGSYGGFMAAVMGTRHHKHFKKAIILNGVLSIPANFWFTDIPEWNLTETLNSDQMTQLTHQNYDDMIRQSPIMEPMRIPTLQFLGAKDRRVPYRQGLLFDALTKKHGTPISTFVYENSNHSLADSVQTSLDIIIKTLFFLEDLDLKQEN